jgi:hypothetical protein
MITEGNYKIYAMSGYNNPYCINEQEFLDDLGRLSTVKKMITYYHKGVDINIRLLINHFVSFYNVFEQHKASELIKFKMDQSHLTTANTIVTFLNKPRLGLIIDLNLLDKLEKETR